ncbi:MAG TPA: GNAT family N-acetyltransferase, partial [Flavitalea sp.]|nr:GNAT family N-acetyltransferase [Flavitalea sp.]
MNFTNTDIHIRSAELNDYDTLYSMMRDFAEFQKTPERLTLTPRQMKQDKDIFKCLVAVTSQNEIVGFSTWFYAYYSWTGKAVYMDDLYVVESYRGQGIGSRLLEAVIEVARQADCNKIKWQVSKWNDAGISYYKKMGATIDDVDINC